MFSGKIPFIASRKIRLVKPPPILLTDGNANAKQTKRQSRNGQRTSTPWAIEQRSNIRRMEGNVDMCVSRHNSTKSRLREREFGKIFGIAASRGFTSNHSSWLLCLCSPKGGSSAIVANSPFARFRLLQIELNLNRIGCMVSFRISSMSLGRRISAPG